MASAVNFFVCLSSFVLLLLSSSSNGARMEAGGEEYWRDIIKNEDIPIPEALKGLLPRREHVHVQTNINGRERLTDDCHTGKTKTPFTNLFEPRPDATSYPADEKLQFARSFEPRPDATAYPAIDKDEKLQFVRSFEPRPDATAYPAA